jgi:hypothetical protein
MPQLRGTGPEGKGRKTGRALGFCLKAEDHKIASELGRGMGQRRNSGGGIGNGKRLKSGLNENGLCKNDLK